MDCAPWKSSVARNSTRSAAVVLCIVSFAPCGQMSSSGGRWRCWSSVASISVARSRPVTRIASCRHMSSWSTSHTPGIPGRPVVVPPPGGAPPHSLLPPPPWPPLLRGLLALLLLALMRAFLPGLGVHLGAVQVLLPVAPSRGVRVVPSSRWASRVSAAPAVFWICRRRAPRRWWCCCCSSRGPLWRPRCWCATTRSPAPAAHPPPH